MLNEHSQLNCREIRIENTNACNARCVLCPREKLTRPIGFMPDARYMNVVDAAIDLGALDVSVFGFGEPLLDKRIGAKIKYATDRGVTTHITTNASLLDLDMATLLLDCGLRNIRFSVHSPVPARYLWIHKQLDWLTVFRNIGNFIDLNNKTGHRCTVHLTCIPMFDDSVDDLRTTWEGRVDYLEVWTPHNWGQGRGYRPITQQRKRTCGRPFSGPVQVQWDGTVIPCCFLTNSELVLGNLNETSLYDILTGEDYERLKEAHRTGNLAGYPCEHCDQLNVVESGVLLYSSRDPEMKLNRLSTSKQHVSRANH